jgi:hypothetical protein
LTRIVQESDERFPVMTCPGKTIYVKKFDAELTGMTPTNASIELEGTGSVFSRGRKTFALGGTHLYGRGDLKKAFAKALWLWYDHAAERYL